MTASAKVRTEGADIAYDYEGAGPLLLTIAGAGGDGKRFSGISAILKDEYTVVRYDRRCCTRSTGDASRPLDMAQQARDAVAIIRNLGAKQAYIFGSSGGGAIACRIAQDSPEVITGLIIHEPSILPVLSDWDEWQQFMAKVEAKVAAEGTKAGMMLFGSSLRGVPRPSPGPADGPGRPLIDNVDFFMNQEYRNIGSYRPDMERIRRNRVAMIATSGRLSEDVYYARTAQVLAEQVGCPYRLMSGHHLAYAADPVVFASELRGLLNEVKASVQT
jgi:pimeloyl-ACP methyl ester carboxylesterase